ncbi:anaphase-promoting complex subunit 5-domain-containing protein [Lipomyces kononenkoae]
MSHDSDLLCTKFLAPAKVALIALMHMYCSHAIETTGRVTLLMLLLQWTDGKDTCLSLLGLSDFKARLSRIACVDGSNAYDALLLKLYDIDSMDDFCSLINDIDLAFFKISNDFGNIAVSSTSLVGHFLRRCYVEFKAMEFDERADLWKAFITFRSYADNDMMTASLHKPEGQRILSSQGSDWRKDSFAIEDVTKMFEFQIEYMQKQGCSLPVSMVETLDKILAHSFRTPSSIYYIRFLHGWRCGDYQEAFENLHRYFDYTMHHNEKIFYQYALLNLAILQADFNCLEEAVWSIQETIKTARENKDNICLNFSLSWLYHFQKSHPRECPPPASSDDATVQFLKVKAKETGMVNLQSVVYLSEAKSMITSGGNATLIFESIMKSAYMNASINLLESIGAQFLVQATFWSRLGISNLGKFYTDGFLDLFQDSSFVEDIVKIACRSAYSLVNCGRYDDALEVLTAIEGTASRSLRIHQIWVTYKTLIMFKRAIRNERMNAVEALSKRLNSMPGVTEDCHLDIRCAQIEHYTRCGNTELAMTLSSQYLESAVVDDLDLYNQLVYMMQYSRIMLLLGRPLRGYTLLMRCISIAERSSLVPVVMESLCLICEIFNSIKNHQQVLEILDATIPQIAECENAELLGKAYYETAKAITGASDLLEVVERGREGATPEARAKIMHAIRYAKLAYTEYEKLEDISRTVDISSMLARLYHIVGPDYVDERDRTAKLNMSLRQMRSDARSSGMLTVT